MRLGSKSDATPIPLLQNARPGGAERFLLMKIFKREVKVCDLPLKTKNFCVIIWRALHLFKHPFLILYSYVRSKPFGNRSIELRGAFKIRLSNKKLDLVTLIVIFCKKVYGDINKNWVVIDVGSNIGMFSLYAAYMGTKRVYAFEPNRESYEMLLRNVHENNLGNVIIPFNLAVEGQDSDYVKINMSSNPNNQILEYIEGQSLEGFQLVRTISLRSIIEGLSIERVDLLKIDCEGSEYVIIPSAKRSTLSRINEIRMEYHKGNLGDIVNHLKEYNFKITKFEPNSTYCGNIWFSKQKCGFFPQKDNKDKLPVDTAPLQYKGR